MNVAFLRLTLCAAIAAACHGQDAAGEPGLTARQLFYSPRAQQQKTGPTAKPRPTRPKTSPEQPGAPAAGRTPPPAAEPRAEQQPDMARVVPENRPSHLGLRYVVRQVTDNGTRDVDPDKTFFSGDRIKIGVETNDAAYLYVVQQGSDGTWEALYPNTAGQHKVRAMSMVDIPPGNEDFKFDATPGTERLLVVLSRTPETDLERLVESLRSGARPRRESAGASQQLMAAASPESINQLRATLQSRNLRVEKRPEVSAGRREEAVYVVNAAMGDAGQRVVAEILLKHR